MTLEVRCYETETCRAAGLRPVSDPFRLRQQRHGLRIGLSAEFGERHRPGCAGKERAAEFVEAGGDGRIVGRKEGEDRVAEDEREERQDDRKDGADRCGSETRAHRLRP